MNAGDTFLQNEKGCILYLLHDSLLIVIAQRAAELVIVHGWTVLLHAPQPGNLSRRRWQKKKWLWLHFWHSFGEVHLRGDWLFAC